LKFHVNTDKGSIKLIGSKFTVPIPKEHKEFWNNLIEQVELSMQSEANEITYLWYQDGKIHFGEIDNSEESTVKKTAFVFDLADYTLKSVSGTVLKPEMANSFNYKILDLVKDSNYTWLLKFYDFWRSIAFEHHNCKKFSFLFALGKNQLRSLKVAEKLLRSGFIPRSCSFLYALLDRAYPPDEQLESMSPWEIIGLPKCVYKSFVANNSLINGFWDYSRFSTFSQIEGLESIWSAVEEYDVIEEFCDLVQQGRYVDALEDLIADKSYNKRRLIQYLFIDLPEKQGFENTSDAIITLQDYASMSAACYEKVEDKYPAYLKTAHDIVLLKFNKLKELEENAEVMKYYDGSCNFASPTFKISEGFPIVIAEPEEVIDIAEEGKAMHHCVATYIDRIKQSEGHTRILFMRSYDKRSYWNPEMFRHVTIEINGNSIVQVRGKYNRDPNEMELRCLNEFCQAKDFKFSESLASVYREIVGHDISEPFDAGLIREEKEVIAC
jgi:hypothetical protein